MLADPANVLRLSTAYRQFAEQEAAGRSPLYATLCRGIAGEHTLLERLAVLPLEKQQPNLLLAAVKYLFGAPRDWSQFRELVVTHWVEILEVIASHRTQTNEPARCATLLPLLALLPPPLALLEVGAAAGLCLLPDRYFYNYGRQCVPPSPPWKDVPVFHCSANATTPIPAKNLEIVWRAGLDTSPLDVADANDREWLRALVWPGEGHRDRLLDEALKVASLDPPRVVRGDLRSDLRALASQAPRAATLVIFHTAVLAYVRDVADRRAFADTVKSLDAQWVSNESGDLFDQPNLPPWPRGRFLLSLNGRGVAYTDAHGTALEWFGEAATNTD
jgi:hypothetical protein